MDNQPENMTVGQASDKVPQFSVGTALREAREQLGLSVADVANRIKFAPRQIEAMEADEFTHLPEMAFVRGFVRSYARLLEIDEVPLLAALPQKRAAPSAIIPANKLAEVPFPSMLTSRRSNLIWLAAGSFVVVVLIIFLSMHDTPSEPQQPVAQTNVETLELPVAELAAASAPVASVAPEKQPAPARAPTVVPAARTQASQATVAKGNGAGEQLVKTQVADAKSAIAPSGLAAMRLVFDEDSWVDVKDANGKVLLSKMNSAGTLVRLSGIPPLSVVIGHASGVHLFYQGKEINLAPYTSVEVARLLLE